jgi:hypothetical protein
MATACFAHGEIEGEASVSLWLTRGSDPGSGRDCRVLAFSRLCRGAELGFHKSVMQTWLSLRERLVKRLAAGRARGWGGHCVCPTNWDGGTLIW